MTFDSLSTITPMRIRTNCKLACCSGMLYVENFSNVPDADLTNQVHPILAPGHFAAAMDYPALLMVLRLATRMMDASLPYWYAAMCRPATCLGPNFEADGTRSTYWEIQNCVRVLTPQQKHLARYALIKSAPYISFDLLDIGSHTNGETEVNLHRRALGFKGNPSAIRLSRTLCDNLLLTTDTLRRAYDIFTLASVTCHEIAHAAINLARRSNRDHYFFSGDAIAEDGFTWESWTFDNLSPSAAESFVPDGFTYYQIQGKPSALTELVLVDTWPNAARVKQYVDNGYHMGRRTVLSPIYIKWTISAKYFIKLTQTSFWDAGRSVSGDDVDLTPDLLSGRRFHATDRAYAEDPSQPGPPLPAGTYLNNDGLILFDYYGIPRIPTVFQWNPTLRAPYQFPSEEEVNLAISESGLWAGEVLVRTLVRLFHYRTGGDKNFKRLVRALVKKNYRKDDDPDGADDTDNLSWGSDSDEDSSDDDRMPYSEEELSD